jgi:hypothetical protein
LGNSKQSHKIKGLVVQVAVTTDQSAGEPSEPMDDNIWELPSKSMGKKGEMANKGAHHGDSRNSIPLTHPDAVMKIHLETSKHSGFSRHTGPWRLERQGFEKGQEGEEEAEREAESWDGRTLV